MKEHALRAFTIWRLVGRQHMRISALEKVIQPAQKKQRVVVARPPATIDSDSDSLDEADLLAEEFIQYA
jgi:hypothetical protein